MSNAFVLPNIRKNFIPDPGYVIFDADLAGADAQVVAWEANDEELKKAFRAGVDIHDKNATDLFGERYTSLEGFARKSKRKQSKTAVHLTNYGGKPMTMTKNPIIGWPLNESEEFQRRWFRLHPGVLEWHQRTQHNLSTSRTIYNRFGYRIIYFDRTDGLLPQALAWVPQSTVAETTFQGALRLERYCPWAEVLLQVHDSLVFQVPLHRSESVKEIREALANPIPYDDPLTIRWGLKCSEASWGDVEEIGEGM